MVPGGQDSRAGDGGDPAHGAGSSAAEMGTCEIGSRIVGSEEVRMGGVLAGLWAVVESMLPSLWNFRTGISGEL